MACLRHNGYDIKPLKEYISTRNLSRPFRDRGPSDERWENVGASTQSLLTFGLIEALTENQVLEDGLVKRGDGGILLLSLDNLPRIIQEWLACIRQMGPEVVYGGSWGKSWGAKSLNT